MVRSHDGDKVFFDIVTGVLQGNTLAPYIFILCINYILRTSLEKSRNLKKGKMLVISRIDYYR